MARQSQWLKHPNKTKSALDSNHTGRKFRNRLAPYGAWQLNDKTSLSPLVRFEGTLFNGLVSTRLHYRTCIHICLVMPFCDNLDVNQVVQINFIRTVPNVVQLLNPFQLIFDFELFIDILLFCRLRNMLLHL